MIEQSDIKKRIVKEKYGDIAIGKKKKANCGSCCTVEPKRATYTVFSENYHGLEGYVESADLHLGCGIPTAFVQIKKGDIVIDLGSGAGNDCFVAGSLAGEDGKVIGIDFTEEMVDKARRNASWMGSSNIEFMLGDIENMPVESNYADVVISNCVLNLVPDKQKAFLEIYRVLKKNGNFSISDIVIRGELPESLQNDASMYAGCVAGAVELDEYLDTIEKVGFHDIRVRSEKRIVLPVEILEKYMTAPEILAFRDGRGGIFSVTITALKN